MGNINAVSKYSASKEDVNNNVPNLMKHTYQRISLSRGKNTTTPQAFKQTLKTKQEKVLRTMPRCSSFEDLSTLLPPLKGMVNDPLYFHWKRSFECPREKPKTVRQTHLRHMKRRVHDMTLAVSGHLTPKGFPAYTDLHVACNKESCQNKSDKPGQYEKETLQLLLLDDDKMSIIQPLTQHNVLLPLPLQLPLPLPQSQPIIVIIATSKKIKAESLTRAKYTSTPFKLLPKVSKTKQAIIVEKLFRDIKNSYFNISLS